MAARARIWTARALGSLALAGTLCAPALASTAATATLADDAKRLAEAGQFAQALQRLDQQPPDLKTRYDNRFLRARILAWDGQHEASAAVLDAMLASNPEDVDVLFMRGQVEYFRKQFDEADRYYAQTLARAPSYTDALDGLDRVARAREAAARESKAPLRVDVSGGVSGFDVDGMDSWSEQTLGVSTERAGLALSAQASRYQRFGLTDVELRAGVADGVRGGWDWGLDVGATPGAEFRPDYSVGARLGRAAGSFGGVTLYPELGLRHDAFAAGAVQTLTPGLTAYFDGGAELGARLIGTLQDDENAQLGWLARARLPVGERLHASLGFAQAPEAIRGVVIDTDSIFGGVALAVTDDLDVRVDVGRDTREDVYTRTFANVGLSLRR